jgi:hypothetical protein
VVYQKKMTWWMMNEWTNEEDEILRSSREEGLPYYQIQKVLQDRGFQRNYEAIKKRASLKGIGSNPKTMSVSFSRPPIVDLDTNFSQTAIPYNVNVPRKSVETNTSKKLYSEGVPRTLQSEFVEPSNQPSNKRVLAIGDIHSPFEHRYYLDFLVETYQKYNCDTVVCMGDEIDSHALSKYDADPDGLSAGHELIEGIKHLQPYYSAFPNVQVVTSNHTVRGYKRGFEAGIPKAFFKSYAEILQAPKGWTWSSSLTIDGVLYHHGEGFSGETGHLKAARSAMRSTVIGHIHSHGGVSYIQTEFGRIFGLNCGCGVDVDQYAFAYGKNCANKPTLGAGIILEGRVAYFEPMSGY